MKLKVLNVNSTVVELGRLSNIFFISAKTLDKTQLCNKLRTAIVKFCGKHREILPTNVDAKNCR